MLGKIYRNLPVVYPFVKRLVHSPRSFLQAVKSFALEGSAPTPAAIEGVNIGAAFAGTEPIAFRVNPSLASTPYLNVVLPGWAVHRMSGGPNTVINLAYRMAEKGVPIRFISASSAAERDPEPMWKHVRELTGIHEKLPHVEAVCGHDRSRHVDIGENDVFMATAWWTAQIVNQALPLTRAKKFIYVIQDFEPGLYNWSTEYSLALETYSMDYLPIVNSRFLADHFSAQFGTSRFGKGCVVIDTAVDRTRFHYEEPTRRKKRLLFYARPSSARRNLFELGTAALFEAVDRGLFSPDEWEFFFMGEQIPAATHGGMTIDCLPWLGYNDYAAKLRQSDIVLSLMLSPHSSYPPLEAAASGALAVTNTFGCKTAERLTAISGNIIPIEPTLEGVIDGLVEAQKRMGDAAARRAASEVNLPASWEEVFKEVVPSAIRLFDQCRHSSKKARRVGQAKDKELSV